jgi:nucleotide-binding universal stress UspA family protein
MAGRDPDMKILVPVDGSSETGRVLGWLVAQELLPAGSRFVVLHILAPLNPCVARSLTPGSLEDYYAAEAQPVWHLVRPILQRHHVQAACRHDIGDAARRIAAVARDEHFDLVIMGSHGHGALANVVLGSVATQVLATTSAPVLLVR